MWCSDRNPAWIFNSHTLIKSFSTQRAYTKWLEAFSGLQDRKVRLPSCHREAVGDYLGHEAMRIRENAVQVTFAKSSKHVILTAIQHLTPMNCAMLAASKDAERYEWVIRYHTSHTGHAPMGKIDPLQILRPNHIKPPEKEGPAPLSPETKETALQMFFTRESKCFTQRLQILGWPSTWCKISSYQKNAGYCATKVQCNSNGIRDN